jgi:hypothetical protein
MLEEVTGLSIIKIMYVGISHRLAIIKVMYVGGSHRLAIIKIMYVGGSHRPVNHRNYVCGRKS